MGGPAGHGQHNKVRAHMHALPPVSLLYISMRITLYVAAVQESLTAGPQVGYQGRNQGPPQACLTSSTVVLANITNTLIFSNSFFSSGPQVGYQGRTQGPSQACLTSSTVVLASITNTLIFSNSFFSSGPQVGHQGRTQGPSQACLTSSTVVLASITNTLIFSNSFFSSGPQVGYQGRNQGPSQACLTSSAIVLASITITLIFSNSFFSSGPQVGHQGRTQGPSQACLTSSTIVLASITNTLIFSNSFFSSGPQAHKSGTKAGPSARHKHAQAKEVLGRKSAKTSVQGGKLTRVLASKQLRDAKRQEMLEKRRKTVAPIVIAILPLTADVDVSEVWKNLLRACAGDGDGDNGMLEADLCSMTMRTVSLHGRSRVQLTLLPPLIGGPRSDPLAVVDLGRAAEVLLLAVDGTESASSGASVKAVDQEGEAAMSILCALGPPKIVGVVIASGKAVDQEGEAALSILRALGLPEIVGVVIGGSAGGDGKINLKERSAAKKRVDKAINSQERSAAKKRADKAINSQIAGEHKVFHVDTPTDCQQLLRHLDHPPTIPVWRRNRASLMVEEAEYKATEGEKSGTLLLTTYIRYAGLSANQMVTIPGESGTLLLTTYIRYAGLSANQLVTIPGVGDFQVEKVEGLDTNGDRNKKGASSEMDTSGSAPVLLAQVYLLL
eukprot:gene12455-15662_t